MPMSNHTKCRKGRFGTDLFADEVRLDSSTGVTQATALWFGYGMEITNDGTGIIVGAPAYNTYEGAVEWLKFDGTTWQQTIVSPEAPLNGSYGYFGFSNDISSNGTRMVSNQYGTTVGNGRVFTFEGDGTTWSDVTYIDDSNYVTGGGSYFGYWGPVMNRSGTKLLVPDFYPEDTYVMDLDRSFGGNPETAVNKRWKQNIDNILEDVGGTLHARISDNGKTILLQRFDTTNRYRLEVWVDSNDGWYREQILSDLPDPRLNTHDELIWAMDLSAAGNTAIVAIRDKIGGAADAPAVFAFTRKAGVWSITQTINYPGVGQPSGIIPGQFQGVSMTGNADTFAVGLSELPNGRIDVYEFDGTEYVLLQTITPTNNANIGHYFSSQVEITPDGKHLVASAPGYNAGEVSAVFRYSRDC